MFKQVEHRLGEANVLRGLGELDASEDPELAKQHFYQAAKPMNQLEWRSKKKTHSAKLESCNHTRIV